MAMRAGDSVATRPVAEQFTGRPVLSAREPYRERLREDVIGRVSSLRKPVDPNVAKHRARCDETLHSISTHIPLRGVTGFGHGCW